MSTKGGPVFTFSLPGGRLVPLPPCQLHHWLQTGGALAARNVNIARIHSSEYVPYVGHTRGQITYGNPKSSTERLSVLKTHQTQVVALL